MTAWVHNASVLRRFVLFGVCAFGPLAGASLPVQLQDSNARYTLSNGVVSVQIDKQSGSVVVLEYRGVSLLGEGLSRSNGYWSLPGSNLEFGKKRSAHIVQDPNTNGGERATVSCEFLYDGDPQSVPADVDLRYSLARGASAVYLEAIWRHPAKYPSLSFGVGRFAAKLNDSIFDWMTIDARRSMKMSSAYDWNHGTPMNMKEARLMNTGVMKGQVEHKYDYSAVQFDTPAYGWWSTTRHVGLWMVSASNEYMSGGPTKLELTAHRDATFTDSLTAPAPPTLLNVWKGPHYGGTSLSVAGGEDWNKVIGPFLLYCNEGKTADAAWHNALSEARRQHEQWPFEWARSAEYPSKTERSVITGKILLRDPLSLKPVQSESVSNLLVGLTHADYLAGDGQEIGWQKDAKYYQYWVRAAPQGDFRIPNIRPGSYTMHAFADGVLGEFVKADVTVERGGNLDVGQLEWVPRRFGRELWSIGVPDRTAGEFLHGDHYWQWGLYYQYPKDFPHDVRYVIGKSDYHKDWNIMQVPRATANTGKGTSTTWSVVFDLNRVPRGEAMLRLALAGTESSTLSIAMNDLPVGVLRGLPNTGVIHRDADRGYWQEKDIRFDASVMRQGTNVLTLTVPAGNVTSGIEYDYLRLELDEGAQTSSPSVNVNAVAPEAYRTVPFYRNEFDSPQKIVSEEDLITQGAHGVWRRKAIPDSDAEWVAEGWGGVEIRNGALHVAPWPFDATGNPKPIKDKQPSHMVVWNRHKLPPDFALSFDMNTDGSTNGLTILFFCANGLNGKDLFDVSLPPRRADYKSYHSGEIENYSDSYWSRNSETEGATNRMRKNPGFALVAEAPSGTTGPANKTYHIEVMKTGGHIEVKINGQSNVTWTDPHPLGAGYIGFRSMSGVTEIRYSHLQISQVSREK